MSRRRNLKETLNAPSPKNLGVVAAIPFVVLALVGTTAALAFGGPRSQERLEEHIRRKQRFLYLQRRGEIHPKIKFKQWERHTYRPTPKGRAGTSATARGG